MILCHGFPIGPLDARRSAGTFPELMDRAARELGCVTMTFNSEFLDGAREGELVTSRGEVTRMGKTTIFVRGMIYSEDRPVMSFSGSIRRFTPRA